MHVRACRRARVSVRGWIECRLRDRRLLRAWPDLQRPPCLLLSSSGLTTGRLRRHPLPPPRASSVLTSGLSTYRHHRIFIDAEIVLLQFPAFCPLGLSASLFPLFKNTMKGQSGQSPSSDVSDHSLFQRKGTFRVGSHGIWASVPHISMVGAFLWWGMHHPYIVEIDRRWWEDAGCRPPMYGLWLPKELLPQPNDLDDFVWVSITW